LGKEIQLPSCFVIQPFDGGKFDKRYRDTFNPAITKAGLEPYRVDADPAVSIPITQIEEGIKQASVCFADITLDNPNVWFELGYALASGKEICVICSEERQGKFPFDIQHRAIIKYRVDSPSDYDVLKENITTRLKAILKKEDAMAAINVPSLLKEADGLTQHEIVVLTAIVENQEGLQDGVTHWALKNQMERLGYNNLAVNIGAGKLIKRNMIEITKIMPHDGSDEPATGYLVKPTGHEWLIENTNILNLKISTAPSSNDEIPF
jgi:hypothetical protein